MIDVSLTCQELSSLTASVDLIEEVVRPSFVVARGGHGDDRRADLEPGKAIKTDDEAFIVLEITSTIFCSIFSHLIFSY